MEKDPTYTQAVAGDSCVISQRAVFYPLKTLDLVKTSKSKEFNESNIVQATLITLICIENTYLLPFRMNKTNILNWSRQK